MYIYKSKTSNRKKYTVERVMYKIDEIDIVDSLPYIHTYTHTHTHIYSLLLIHSLTHLFFPPCILFLSHSYIFLS